MLILLSACANPGPDGLYGTRPLEARPAPDFSATDSGGSARGRDDLIGQPTVLWFYPAAATSG